MQIAAITMVYNEPIFLPIWLRHYGGQVGVQNLFVIDHGSDDGSTDDLGGANRIRLPRSPQDDRKRARMVSRIVAGLLDYYDAVINVDVDEIVVADPRRFESLMDFAAGTSAPVTTALGLNVVQRPALEPALDPSSPILAQRHWVKMVSPMCKPCFVKVPVTWTPGFHRCDAAPHFDGLYLFHLRYFDLSLGLARLAKTRAMPWASPAAGAHQRVDDAHWRAWFEHFDRSPAYGDLWDGSAAEAFTQRFVEGATVGPGAEPTYLHEITPEVFRIPDALRGAF